MNFQKMDSLGALIEGNKARMAEDSTRINQDRVLQDIAAAAQKMQQEAALHPGALDEQQARIKQSNAAADYSGTLSGNARAEENRKKSAWFVGQVIQQGGVPGAVDGYAEEAGIPANHPLRQMAKSAWEASQGWDPKKGPSPIEQLQQKLAMGDDKSRQATANAEAQFKRESMKQDEMTARTEATNASRERIAQTAAAAKMSAARLAQQAAQTRNFSLQQYAARLIAEADQAAARGDMVEAQRISKQAEDAMQQAIRLEAAKGTAKEEAEAAKLAAITGQKIDTRGAGSAGASAAAASGPKVGGGQPAAPAATQAPDQSKIKAALGSAYDPNKQYEVDADGTIYELRPKK